MGEMKKITSVTDLARAIDGRSDDQINADSQGQYEQTCRRIADGMKERFRPENADGATAVIQYDVKAPDAIHTFQLDVANDKCEVSSGAAAPARVTLALSFPDFLRLVSGELDGMQAFFSGRLKVSGDVMFAQKMQSWFRPT